MPVGEGEVGGQDEAFLFVPPADDLEDQVGISVVESEKHELVDDEQSDFGVVVEASIESASGLLGAEVEQELGGGEKEHGAPGKDGAMGDVLGDHGLTQSARCDEHDVARALEKVEREEG